MARPVWFVKIIQHFFTERSTIANWTKHSSLIKKLVDFFLFHGDEIFYLPKDQVIREVVSRDLNEAEKFLSTYLPDDSGGSSPPGWSYESALDTQTEVRVVVREDIEQTPSINLPSKMIREFINEANHIWLMDKCLCRDNMQCKDYPIELGCIFMGEAVMGINPRLGHLATKEEAIARIDLAAQHGLIHLIGKNKIDTQWMGVHPGGKLLTVCNCCPCCCLYKVLPDLHDDIAAKVQKMPGLEVTIDSALCIGCGRCTDESVCMTHNLTLVDGEAVMGNHCVGCSRCYEVCPVGAIDVNITNDQFIQETVKRLKERVNVQ